MVAVAGDPPKKKGGQLAGDTQQETCPFCRKANGKPAFDHRFIRLCPKLKQNQSNALEPAEIKRIVRQEKRCFMCFSKGHASRNCPGPDSLRCKCKEKHHPLFHDKDATTKGGLAAAQESAEKKSAPKRA